MRKTFLIFAFLAFAPLAGCGELGSLSGPQIEAQTPNQEAYALQETYDAFLDTVERLTDNGVLTGNAAAQAANVVEAAGVAYRSAREAILTGAPDKLQLVIGFQQVLLRINPLIAGGNNGS